MDALPDLLLLEDDPPSRLFLQKALSALPAQVETVATLAQARRAIQARSFALWLFDARLPDGDSASLLGQMRAEGYRTSAIALTADPEPSRRRALLDAGFDVVAIKPLTTQALHTLVRARLPALDHNGANNAPLWNEAHALAAAGGVVSTRDALRRLFITELSCLHRGILEALDHNDTRTAGELLHRLKGSCAFVGAEALLQATRALASAPTDTSAGVRFSEECARLTS